MKETLTHPLAASSFTNLVRLAAAYGCDARCVPRLLMLMLLSLARLPAAWAAKARYGRRVAAQEVEPPLFIIGHWRSGTTHLQNLMNEDPQFGRVELLHAAMPHEFLVLPESAKARMNRLLPEKRLMDNVRIAADVPWEEELALTAVGRLSFYHVSFFPKSMRRVFRDAVLFGGGDPVLVDRWKRQYLAFVRQVQFVQPGKRLLLKNPANTARLRLAREMFPGARFVHLHRDPYKVFASSVHLYLSAQEAWGLQATSRDGVVAHVLESYPQLMNAYFEQRKDVPENELAEVRFDELQSDPLGALARIYDRLELSGYDAAVEHFKRYVESQRNYRKNRHVLSQGDRDTVARLWKPVFEELGYEI